MNKHEINFIEQIAEKDCGLACLTMLFNYYKMNLNYDVMLSNYTIPSTGLSFFNMSTICEEMGFESESYRIIEDFSLIELKENTPFIAHWDDGKHFVVVEYISKKSVFILDPKVGKLKLSEKEFKELFSGNIFTISKKLEHNIKESESKDSIFQTIKILIKDNKILLTLLLVISIVIGVINLFPSLLYGKIIDRVTEGNYELSVTFILIVILSIVTLFAVSFLQEYMRIRLQIKMDDLLLKSYFSHFLRIPLPFYKERNQGDLIYRFNLLGQLKDIVLVHGLGNILNIITLLVYLFVLIKISLDLTIVIIISALLLISFLLLFSEVSLRQSKKVILSQSSVQELLAESINIIDDIKINGTAENLELKMNDLLTKFLINTKKYDLLSLGIESVTSSFKTMQTVLTFLIGVFFLSQGSLTIGELMAFVMISESFFSPVYGMIDSYFYFINISSIYNKLRDVMNQPNEALINKDKVKLTDFQGKIEFKNVYFRYSKFTNFIISDASFVIEPGEIIKISGDSGTGKSTLLKLILGLYQPEKGRIFLDDIDINMIDMDYFRNSSGVLLKESKLFNSTIIENITFSKIYDNEKLKFSAEKTDLSTMLEKNYLSYHSTISENGMNLSEGQKQRILLTRVFYKEAKLIILDESTNSLDKISEKHIMNNINNLNVTRLIVSHNNVPIEYNHLLKIDENGYVYYN